MKFHSLRPQLDLWELAVSGAELRVGVRAGAYDIPVFFETRFRGGGFQVEFSHFTGNATFDHRIFDVPRKYMTMLLCYIERLTPLQLSAPLNWDE